MNKDFLNYRQTIGLATMEGRGFYYPTDTLLGLDGRIYTVSRSLDGQARPMRVTIYDLAEEYYGTFASYGEEIGQLIWPSSITQNSKGHIFISDEYLNRITVFEPDGTVIGTWGELGKGPGQLDGPSGLAFDGEDKLYVVDQHNHRIQVMSACGDFLFSFGEQGTKEGLFDLPWGITVVPNGDVYVADWHNDRIQRFTNDGTFLASYGKGNPRNTEFFKPASVAVDKEGYMYVADWGNELVKVLNKNGTLIQTLRGEATISKWAADFLSVNVEEAKYREKSDLEPKLNHLIEDAHDLSAHVEKLFWAPISIQIDDSNRVYVTESNRHRLQIYERTEPPGG